MFSIYMGFLLQQQVALADIPWATIKLNSTWDAFFWETTRSSYPQRLYHQCRVNPTVPEFTGSALPCLNPRSSLHWQWAAKPQSRSWSCLVPRHWPCQSRARWRRGRCQRTWARAHRWWRCCRPRGCRPPRRWAGSTAQPRAPGPRSQSSTSPHGTPCAGTQARAGNAQIRFNTALLSAETEHTAVTPKGHRAVMSLSFFFPLHLSSPVIIHLHLF